MVVEEEDLKLKMNVGIVEKRDIGKMNVENHKENGLDQNDQNLEVLHLVRQEADLTKEKAKKKHRSSSSRSRSNSKDRKHSKRKQKN